MLFQTEILLFEKILILFIKSIFIGIAVSVPLGPVGSICLRRAINHGRKYGFISGVGAATADLFFALIAILGFTIIIDFIDKNIVLLKVISSVVLILIAIKSFKRTSKSEERKPLPFLNKITTHSQLVSDFITTFILTITNPITIFSFLAIFSGFRILETNYYFFEIFIILAGMFIGSSLWWFSIVQIIYLIKKKYSIGSLIWVNYISIFILVISAIYILVS